jgi:hypothetical protein
MTHFFHASVDRNVLGWVRFLRGPPRQRTRITHASTQASKHSISGVYIGRFVMEWVENGRREHDNGRFIFTATPHVRVPVRSFVVCFCTTSVRRTVVVSSCRCHFFFFLEEHAPPSCCDTSSYCCRLRSSFPPRHAAQGFSGLEWPNVPRVLGPPPPIRSMRNANTVRSLPSAVCGFVAY